MRENILTINNKLLSTIQEQNGAHYAPYTDATSLSSDLSHLIREASSSSDETLAKDLIEVDRLVNVFGLHLASLEWRQHSDQVIDLVNALADKRDGSNPNLRALESTARNRKMKRLLGSQEPLYTENTNIENLSDENKELLASLQALAQIQKENGPDAVKELIIANTDDAAPLLALQHLAKNLGIQKVQNNTAV